MLDASVAIFTEKEFDYVRNCVVYGLLHFPPAERSIELSIAHVLCLARDEDEGEDAHNA